MKYSWRHLTSSGHFFCRKSQQMAPPHLQFHSVAPSVGWFSKKMTAWFFQDFSQKSSAWFFQSKNQPIDGITVVFNVVLKKFYKELKLGDIHYDVFIFNLRLIFLKLKNLYPNLFLISYTNFSNFRSTLYFCVVIRDRPRWHLLFSISTF